jgi:flagellar biosynthesis protein FlhF
MLVKRYVVKEVPEALALIRQDLGADAVILSTKKIQTRTFFGIFSKNKIEVIAASSDPTDPTVAKDKGVPLRNVQSKQPKHQATPAPMPVAIDLTTPIDDNGKESESGTIASPHFPKPPVHERVVNESQASYQDVLGEIKRLRHMVHRMADAQFNHLPKPLAVIRSLLLQQEIKEERVAEILETLMDQTDAETWDLAKARWETQQILLKEMSHWGQPSAIQPATRVAAFIGATGVGKTTTIAKIAAEQVLQNRKKLALITTDTYRIAAVEQLRTYANILNIPIEVAFTPEDYQKALVAFRNYDLILVDTAGRNYQDPKYVKDIAQYFEVSRPDEIYLVLSSATKISDNYRMIENFSDLNVDKFVFTKLDETSSYGLIYNLMREYHKPFSYITNGQDVPDHLSLLTPENLVNLLIGENSYV